MISPGFFWEALCRLWCMEGEPTKEHSGLCELKKHRSQLGECGRKRGAIINHKFLSEPVMVGS